MKNFLVWLAVVAVAVLATAFIATEAQGQTLSISASGDRGAIHYHHQGQVPARIGVRPEYRPPVIIYHPPVIVTPVVPGYGYEQRGIPWSVYEQQRYHRECYVFDRWTRGYRPC